MPLALPLGLNARGVKTQAQHQIQAQQLNFFSIRALNP
jgi:hypothetical protein